MFFIVLPNVDFDTSWVNKFIPIIKKRRRKLKCLVFRFPCNDKIRLFCSTELYFVVFLGKNV